MVKRIAVAVMCAAMALALSGCGGPGVPIGWDESVEIVNLTRAADSWVAGVEVYDVAAMAGDLIMAPDFMLTIIENGRNYTKGLGKLRDELAADEDNQLAFRSEAGLGIRLDIDGGGADGDIINGMDDVNSWTIARISKYEADVTALFEVFEWADGVSTWRSDSGVITAHFIRTYGAWKLLTMEIRFGAGNYAGAGSVGVIRTLGFGF
ncbi:MAG: hypothetical protein BWY85_01373 [Firmicutes bacterium ADurb.Bin506]|jgi:hypothetical protein|nr:MAG: hypothetical protein BWY85_01373 [Firmicutes bacterium ADurb.Bin506]